MPLSQIVERSSIFLNPHLFILVPGAQFLLSLLILPQPAAPLTPTSPFLLRPSLVERFGPDTIGHLRLAGSLRQTTSLPLTRAKKRTFPRTLSISALAMMINPFFLRSSCSSMVSVGVVVFPLLTRISARLSCVFAQSSLLFGLFQSSSCSSPLHHPPGSVTTLRPTAPRFHAVTSSVCGYTGAFVLLAFSRSLWHSLSRFSWLRCTPLDYHPLTARCTGLHTHI